MSKPSPTRYRTTNWSSYSASLHRRGSLLIWLDQEMTWFAPPDGKPGRSAVFSDAAIQFCLTIKILFKLPLRQTTEMVASLLKMAELDWALPDYTTLCRRQKTLAVQIAYRRADRPPTARPLQSSRSARTAGRGKKTARPQSLATKRCVPPGTIEGRSGSAGQDITSEAGSRPRCCASRHSENASPRETQTAKQAKSKSASPSSTASMRSAPLKS